MTGAPPFADIASLWQDSALPGPVLPPLAGDLHADVAIIGGGYTGLSTARYLAQAGLQPVVLEASRIGWGASGRNGGVVSGKFRIGFAEMARRWGLDTARRMHDLGIEAIEHVGETVAALDIAGADYRPTGSLRCAHTPGALAALRAEADWLAGTLGDRAISMLDADAMAAETGSGDFTGGMLNRHGGVIHPLNYVRGLARALAGQGVPVLAETPVTALRRSRDGVELVTPGGVVRARQAVIATNAYSDLTPATAPVRKRLIPFRSAMIATEVLDRSPLVHDRSYTETRRMMRWFRMAQGRLVYGGRGAFGKTDSDAAFASLERAMRRQFPQLAGVAVTHRWSGLVAMTMDSLPHLGRLDDRVTFALGYNGTGVALASMIGRHVARLVQGLSVDAGLLGSQPLRPVPLYPVREPAVRLVAGYYQFLDAIGR
ncbi:MAG: FAD-dependent oxidoreductase [Paracoccus aminovorans]|nr:FAD-dependent oxidoreductase [Paracoccus aminovorans]